MELPAALDALPVHKGAVGRAQIQDPYPVTLGFDPRMGAGRELVPVERDRVFARTADRDGHGPGIELLPDRDRLAPLDDQSPGAGDLVLGRTEVTFERS